MKMNTATTIDGYIRNYPKDLQITLQKMRAAIHAAAPHATEAIKYGLATFVYHGNLVHFGAFDKHIGFYPAASGVAAFAKELSKYEGSKGAVRFPFGTPIPYPLITKIVKYRVKENDAKAAAKKKR